MNQVFTQVTDIDRCRQVHFYVAFIAVDIVAVDVTLHRNCPRHTLQSTHADLNLLFTLHRL